MNKKCLFSGEAPNLESFCSQKINDNSRENISTIVFDYRNNLNINAPILSLAEFIPYLSKNEVAELFADIAARTSPDSAHLVHRYIYLLSDFAEKSGLSLFEDIPVFSLMELTERYNDMPLHYFLEDNYSSLASLENTVNYVVNSIGKPKFDIRNALNRGRVFLIRNQRLGRSIYQKEILSTVLDCISEFANPAATELYFNGISYENADIVSDFLSRTQFKKTVAVDDVFTFENTVTSRLLYGIDKVVFFKHRSGESCQKIADYIGKEERYQVGINRYPDTVFSTVGRIIRGGISLTNSASIVGSDRSNTGYSANLTEKYRIRPNDIMSLQQNQCIIVNTKDHSFSVETV